MKKIKGVLINVEKETVEVVEIDKTLSEYYRILNCTTIDIPSRKIGERYFDIICDDEGLFKDKPKISAVTMDGKPALVGNLFVVKFDGEEDITSLNDNDIEYIKSKIKRYGTNVYPNPYPMLTELEF